MVEDGTLRVANRNDESRPRIRIRMSEGESATRADTMIVMLDKEASRLRRREEFEEQCRYLNQESKVSRTA